MSFTSIKFLYFLAAFLVVYALCPARYRRSLVSTSSLHHAHTPQRPAMRNPSFKNHIFMRLLVDKKHRCG